MQDLETGEDGRKKPRRRKRLCRRLVPVRL
jgi:hypothetical protein